MCSVGINYLTIISVIKQDYLLQSLLASYTLVARSAAAAQQQGGPCVLH